MLATVDTPAHLALRMTCGFRSTMLPILQMRKLGLREVKSLVPGHAAELRL